MGADSKLGAVQILKDEEINLLRQQRPIVCVIVTTSYRQEKISRGRVEEVDLHMINDIDGGYTVSASKEKKKEKKTLCFC